MTDRFQLAPDVEAELAEVLAPGLQLLQVIGHGGMGVVYLARDPALKRNVVVKVLAPALALDPVSRSRFEREAQTAAAVAHPNVVSVFQVGALARSRTSYFVMEHVEGKTLEDAFPLGTVVAEGRARRILGEVASALAAAHARGLVHRDIKPANVMLDADSDHVTVLDFGISAASTPARQAELGTKLTQPGVSIGTPTYMSPEQASGEEITAKSDIYSLGVVAYELVIGRPLFAETNPMALIAAHINRQPPLVALGRPDVDPTMATLIDRMLAKSPADRPSAAECMRTLLPSQHALIEWPPPGLETLRGIGVRFTLSVAVTGATAMAALLSFLAQPEAYDPIVVGGERWSLLILTLLMTVVASALWLVASTVRVAHRVVAGRRAGYPWRVLVDVLIDASNSTSALINGTGPFALVPSETRARFLRARRLRAAVTLGTALAAILLPILWVAGVTGGWADSGTKLISEIEFIALTFPLVIGGLLAFDLGRAERRTHRRPRRFLEWRPAAIVRADVLDAWLSTSGNGARASRPRAFRTALAILPVSIAILLVIAIVEAVTTGVRVENQRRGVSPQVSMRTFTAESLRPMPWQALDQLSASVAGMPRPGAPVDLEAARLMSAGGWSGHGGVPSYILVDSVKLAALPRPPHLTSLANLEHCARAQFARVTVARPDVISGFTSDTLDPWLAIWTRVARSGALPNLWSYASDAFSRDTTPDWRVEYRSTHHVACLAMKSGLVRLQGGNPEGALVRARELIAVGRHHLHSPFTLVYFHGLGLLDAGAQLMQEVGRSSDRAELIAQAERLHTLVARARDDDRRLNVAVSALFADPADSSALWIVGDTALAPSWRFRAARMTVIGSCSNAREILFGPAPGRAALLEGAVSRLGDIDNVEMLTGRMREMLPGLTSVEYMREVLAASGVAVWIGGRVMPNWGRSTFRFRLSVCPVMGWVD